MNKLIKDALVLTLIAVVAGVALGAVYEVTKEPIRAANEAAQQEAYRALFPDADEFTENDSFDAATITEEVNAQLASDGINGFAQGDLQVDACIDAISGGDVVGEIYTITSNKGYGGKITLSVGISDDSMLTGYKITSISETPGLGMKSTEERFYSQFEGIDADLLTVTKQAPGAGEIQAISGATITSKAVSNAVNAAVTSFNIMNGGGK